MPVWEDDNGEYSFVGKLRLCIPDQALCKLWAWKGDPVKLVPAYILRRSKHASTALAYPLSCCSISLFRPAVTSVPSSCKSLWPNVFPILLDFDQCSLSQHAVFIPELLMVFSKQEICICINEQHNSWFHRSVASRPIEWHWETQGHIQFRARLLCNTHVWRTGVTWSVCTDAQHY